MPRLSFTHLALKSIKPPGRGAAGEVAQVDYWDTSQPGFGMRVSSTGARTWVLITRVLREGYPKQIRVGLGSYASKDDDPAGGLTLAAARTKAASLSAVAKAGKDPSQIERDEKESRLEKSRATFAAIAGQFVERHSKKHNRSWAETARILGVERGEGEADYCGKLRSKPIAEIGRRDIATLLDHVEDNHGPVMADRVLAQVRAMFNWWATRDDAFRSPIVKGMARTKPRERARKRILSDDEIRALWHATDKSEPRVFGSLVRILLLSAQRRDEGAKARRTETNGNVWTIPGERYKTKTGNVVPLSPQAAATLAALPDVGPYYFTTDGVRPFSGYSKAKAKLDKLLLAELRKIDPNAKLEPWVLHDLRRTARSLMSRAGVSSRAAEAVLGHVIPGVEGVYDRHDYTKEKADALTRLGELIERIRAPQGDNIVELRPAIA